MNGAPRELGSAESGAARPARRLGLASTERLAAGGVLMLLLAFVAVPLALLAVQALAPAGWAALGERTNLVALCNTLKVCLGVLVFTLAVGLPLGWLLGRTDLSHRTVWRTLLTVPYIVPPYVGAIAWIELLNPTNGFLNRVLGAVGIPPLDIYGVGGMIWVLGLFLAPFIFLGTADALERVDPALEQAARLSGAGPLRVLLDITFPMAIPAIASGAGFVVAASAAAFGVPYLLASGTARPDWVLTTRIYQALALDPATGRPVAVALSVALLAVGVLLPALARRLLERRRRFVGITGKASRGGCVALGRWRWVATGALVIYVGLAVVLPIATIAATSVMRTFGGGLLGGNLSLEHWHTVLFERPDTLGSIVRSGLLAAGAATGAVVVGGIVAWLAERGRARTHRLLALFARLPYAVPGTVLALGMLLAFSREIRVIVLDRVTFVFALADTVWLLGIAYMVKYLAFPVGGIGAALSGIDPSLEEAARLSGAGWFRTMKDIAVPLVMPAVLGAWFLVVMPAFSEITMSILLHGPRTPVVGTVLFDLQTYADPPAAAVLAMVVTAVVLGASAGVRWATGGRVGI